MISPSGTGSVVVEKEVLEFADQQGLHVREYPTTATATAVVKQETKSQSLHFETRYMDYVADHPLIFMGIPSVGFLYGAILETVLDTDFSGAIVSTTAKFVITLASSPLFLASVALSIGTSILYSQKKILAKTRDTSEEIERL